MKTELSVAVECIHGNDEYEKLKDFYRLRMSHYLSRLMREYAIESKKWHELSNKVNDKHNKKFSERSLRYMFNEHKYWDDFINLKKYSDLNGISLLEFIIYIENSEKKEISPIKRWQQDVINVLKIIDNDKDIKIRQRLSSCLCDSIINHKSDIIYFVEIIEIINKFLKNKRFIKKNNDKYEKLLFALKSFKIFLT